MRALAIGAGPEQVGAISIVRQLGAEVLALDGNSRAEGSRAANNFVHIDLMDTQAVLQIARDFNPDFLVPASLARPLITAGVVNDMMGLEGVTERAALIANDKQTMYNVFTAQKIPMARQIAVSNHAEMCTVTEALGFPVIVKPRFGSGSRGVTLVEQENELPTVSIDANWLVAEALTGREIGVDGAVINGAVHLYSIRWKRLTPAPNRQAISYFMIDPSREIISEQVAEIAMMAFTVLKCDNVLFHADIMVSEEGEASLIELAPRPSGHAIHSALLPISYGESVLNSFVSSVLMLRTRAPLIFRQPSFFSFLPIPAGRVTARPDFGSIMEGTGRISVECKLQEGATLFPLTDGPSALSRGYMTMLTEDESEGMRVAERLAARVRLEAV